jgi:hypothetical protein
VTIVSAGLASKRMGDALGGAARAGLAATATVNSGEGIVFLRPCLDPKLCVDFPFLPGRVIGGPLLAEVFDYFSFNRKSFL